MREWLRTLRCEKGLTQAETAKKLGIGQSYYSAIEQGERLKELGLLFAVEISELLQVSLDKIVEEEKALREEVQE